MKASRPSELIPLPREASVQARQNWASAGNLEAKISRPPALTSSLGSQVTS